MLFETGLIGVNKRSIRLRRMGSLGSTDGRDMLVGLIGPELGFIERGGAGVEVIRAVYLRRELIGPLCSAQHVSNWPQGQLETCYGERSPRLIP